MTFFPGKIGEADSTIMPSSRQWIRNKVTELSNDPADFGIVLFLNMPALGVASAARTSFCINYISNVLSDYPDNAICFVVHPNRAGQQEGRTSVWTCAQHLNLN